MSQHINVQYGHMVRFSTHRAIDCKQMSRALSPGELNGSEGPDREAHRGQMSVGWMWR